MPHAAPRVDAVETDSNAESDALSDHHVADNTLPHKRLWALWVRVVPLTGT